ncbi:MAG TPA: 2-oxoglutarate dehydrogenase, E2 component, dihydrolipoamide succinyltransferase, partial [Nocardioidaceae bacterium]|nr:2-oxoglutarate dehydrogenase, E2 component, dihydrolipoamide succinyltransferase [Nocardioidaceae bacterium]
MATSVTLPALGESVTEGTITRWLKQPGDRVEVDEPLLEVSTDKVDTEIPSPVAGTLLEIKADEDETVEVGAELATIGDEGESAESGGEGESTESGGDGEFAESGGGAEETSEKESTEAQEAEGEEQGAGAGEGAGGETGESAAPPEEESGRQTQPQGEVPEAKTDSTGPAQETAPSSADTKPEAEASREGTKAGGGGSPVTLPALGESVTEGTVTRWLKQVGDEIAVDEPLLEVSTDKVDTEIPSPVAGTLLEIKVQEDETVEVGAELAIVGSGEAATPSEEAPKTPEPATEATGAQQEEEKAEEAAESGQAKARDEAAADAQAEPSEEKPAEPRQEKAEAPREEAPKEQPAPSKESGEGAYVTPLVRKMAADQGVDLSQVEGTGVGGRIRKQDVLEAAKAQKAAAEKKPEPEPAAASGAPAAKPSAAPSPLRGKSEPLSRLRKVIATRMVESLQTSAQLTTVVEVDVTAIARLRDSVKAEFAEREGVKLSFMPFLAKATVDALKSHPSLNASIDTEKGEVTYYDHENLGVAVDTEKGLLVPVLKDAGDLSVAGLARKIADIAERTRSNKIGPDELSGGTFTLTNTGSRGALFDTPIINQPQVAILGTGAVVKRAVVVDDPNLGELILPRSMVYLSLSYDHRLVDGADAARFLSTVKERLEG